MKLSVHEQGRLMIHVAAGLAGSGGPGAAPEPSGGVALLTGTRAVGSLLLAGPDWAPAEAVGAGRDGRRLPLAGAGAQVVALAGDASALRRLLDAGASGPAFDRSPGRARTGACSPSF